MNPARRSVVLASAHMAAARAAVLAPVFAGCAALNPNRVTLSQADLNRLAAREFPRRRRVLEIFDVTLDAPRRQLVPERQRVAAALDLQARERLLAGTWQARLNFDAALRWQPSDQTLRLSEVRVQDLALADPQGASRSAAERVAAALVELALDDLAVYRLPAERWLELQRRGVQPGAVDVTPRGVEITFVPLAR
jgi:hypothetical protein